VSELRGLIFDVDGTLADNEQDGHRVAFNGAFEDAGLDWHWDEETYGRLLDVFGGKERIRYFIDRFSSHFTPPDDLDGFIQRLHRHKTARYVELLHSAGIPLRPGVDRLIREAHAVGLQLAIASTTTQENVLALLAKNLGEDCVDWFDVFACGDVVPNKKPASDIYRYALAQLSLSADECIAVEDSESGLASAQGAGLLTLITTNPTTRDQNFTGAAIVLDGLGEPDAPFTVLAGDAGGAQWVDVAFLKRLHARRWAHGE